MKFIKIIGFIGLVISKEVGFIYKLFDWFYFYVVLYMMGYELKEIFLVVKMCYIIVMYVILYEILKIYFGSKIMYVFLKIFFRIRIN